VAAHRRGALERSELLVEDWLVARQRSTDVEARMVAVLDDLDLTELVTSIPSLSPVSAAAILAETGDLTRFRTHEPQVKHAGLAPREQTSGVRRPPRISGRGRRDCAWPPGVRSGATRYRTANAWIDRPSTRASRRIAANSSTLESKPRPPPRPVTTLEL
jgi:transposase